ncbi:MULTISPECIES: LytR/AlgR family response regulator transcription factor [Marinobacter]|uniref:DNA-binding response regulator n=1 Tax=Marinobacter profundi TaxID=2666256 RepID=A0A2G1UJF0_9GAMM|nr:MULTISPECIES: LytTR family DNA-binding domain-containing protein [Marinobacter]MBD3655738.1 response regulator transcription factor [Marinobacter sp.]PHQ14614.1 DNA-binding response regulator [Marinobacter profundi]
MNQPSPASPRRKVLIADDEPLARQRVRRLLDELPGYEVCGEAADGNAVLNQVASLHPDIVLLDIRMPGMDGMEAAGRLQALDSPPAIIFCTAFDHYAIDAFGVQAAAYLLKPVRREALADALARAGRLNRLQRQALQVAPADREERLAIRTHRGTELLDVGQIALCEADQKYVTIHHTRGESLCDYTLKELELAYPDDLLRVHRHTLVGVRYIHGIVRCADGQLAVRLPEPWGQRAVSRRHGSAVRQWLREHQPG